MSRYGPFMINGVPIPTPTQYEFGIEDLSTEETGRTLDGYMHKDVVAVKDYYKCTWSHLSWADTAQLMNAIDGKTQVTFTYADPRYPEQFVTGDFYIGSRGGTALDLSDPPRGWTNINFQFTRM